MQAKITKTGLALNIDETYPEQIFLFGHNTINHSRAIACSDWHYVYKKIKIYFKS